MTAEQQSQIAVWRQKAAEGTLTIEEMREIVVLLRASRRTAAAASEQARRTRAKAAIPSADDLLSELEGL